MNTPEPSSPAQSPHRFFHTMVVVGGGLAATHCGGTAVDGRSSSEDPNETPMNEDPIFGVGGGAQAVPASPDGSGGAFMSPEPIAPIPETYPLAPVDYISMGGSSPIVDTCEMAQMDCSDAYPDCRESSLGVGVGVELDDCSCDPTRPRDEQDCAEGEYLFCSLGFLDLDSDGATEHVKPIHCSCVPNDMEGELLMSGRSSPYCWRQSEKTVLCGCQYIILR